MMVGYAIEPQWEPWIRAGDLVLIWAGTHVVGDQGAVKHWALDVDWRCQDDVRRGTLCGRGRDLCNTGSLGRGLEMSG